jgi:hypothetical protein
MPKTDRNNCEKINLVEQTIKYCVFSATLNELEQLETDISLLSKLAC